MAAESIIRVTSREREEAVEGLRAAYAAGCLDDTELEERSSEAYAAKTRGDLASLVSDLPPLPGATGADIAAARRGGWFRRVRHSLHGWGWLVLAAAGAWIIAVTAGGTLAMPLIFLWLVVVRACGRPSSR